MGALKIFGLGLSRTGTKSLTLALGMLGYDVLHYPDDEGTLADLMNGGGDFELLKHHDGITDITVAPYYGQLDEKYPGSKFILTVRDKPAWLESLHRHWAGRPPFEDLPGGETHMKIRRFLRAAVYGTYVFNEQRLSLVHDGHVKGVKAYFKARPGDLLLMDICNGDKWDKLCPFLNASMPDAPFPHIRERDLEPSRTPLGLKAQRSG